MSHVDSLRALPTSVEVLAQALHGGPVLLYPERNRLNNEENADLSSEAGEVRRQLEARQMHMVPPPVYVDDKAPRWWTLDVRPASLSDHRGAEPRGDLAPLRDPETDLLRALMLTPPRDETEGLARWTVPQREIAAGLHWSESHVSSSLSRLRKRRPFKDAIPTKTKGGPDPYLDQRIIRADTLEVTAAWQTARFQPDPYKRAYALLSGERAYYYSYRLTPRAVVHAAEEADSDTKARLRLQDIVDFRWRLRQRALLAFREIEHYDRMITLYRLWEEYFHNDEEYRKDREKNRGLPRDVFFGLQSLLKSEDGGRPLPALDALGRIKLERHGGRSLRDAASVDVLVHYSPPEVQTLTQRIATRTKELIDSGASQSAPETGPEAAPRELAVTWDDVDLLTKALLHQLLSPSKDEYQRRRVLGYYHVVLSLGRSGAPLAAAIAETIDCRYLGWLSTSRTLVADGSARPKVWIRGIEFPLVRARRVIICDAAVASGETVITALEQVQRFYPDAEVTVASYVLNRRARMRARSSDRVRSESFRPVRWVSGLEVDNELPQNVRLKFPWKRYANKRP